MTDTVYNTLPTHMQDGARLYVERGVDPGDFLYAVLCDQLVEAFGRADYINSFCMKVWAEWLWNEAPHACWGSPKKVAAWIESKRILRTEP